MNTNKMFLLIPAWRRANSNFSLYFLCNIIFRASISYVCLFKCASIHINSSQSQAILIGTVFCDDFRMPSVVMVCLHFIQECWVPSGLHCSVPSCSCLFSCTTLLPLLYPLLSLVLSTYLLREDLEILQLLQLISSAEEQPSIRQQ